MQQTLPPKPKDSSAQGGRPRGREVGVLGGTRVLEGAGAGWFSCCLAAGRIVGIAVVAAGVDIDVGVGMRIEEEESAGGINIPIPCCCCC